MAAEVRVEHTYPAALTFLRLHGPDAIAVLHDLLAHAEKRGAELVVQASARQVAQRLGFTSKDTVNRRLRQLSRAGVLHRSAADRGAAFEAPIYSIVLKNTGISCTADAGLQPGRGGSA